MEDAYSKRRDRLCGGKGYQIVPDPGIPPIRVYIFPEDGKEKISDEKIFACARLFCNAERAEQNSVFPAIAVDGGPLQASVLTSGIKREPGRKPCFAKDTGLHFSVSHSGEFWVCAFSRQETGIDIQQKIQNYNRGIAKRFFHAAEHAYLEAGGFDDFFMIWTAKESYVKYTGRGIDGGFSDFSVIKNGRIQNNVNGADLKFLPVHSDYALCLCAGKIGGVFIENRPRTF